MCGHDLATKKEKEISLRQTFFEMDMSSNQLQAWSGALVPMAAAG